MLLERTIPGGIASRTPPRCGYLGLSPQEIHFFPAIRKFFAAVEAHNVGSARRTGLLGPSRRLPPLGNREAGLLMCTAEQIIQPQTHSA